MPKTENVVGAVIDLEIFHIPFQVINYFAISTAIFPGHEQCTMSASPPTILIIPLRHLVVSWHIFWG